MKYGFLGLKLLLSAVMVALVLAYVDIGPALAMLAHNPLALVVAVVLLSVQSWFAALRLPLIAKMFGHRITILTGLKLWLIGVFTGQTLVTFVAGDAVRVVLLRRQGMQLRGAARAVIFDRITGIAVLLAMSLVSIGVLLAMPLDMQMKHGLLGLGLLCVGLLGGLAISPAMPWLMGYFPESIRAHKIVMKLLDVLAIAAEGLRHPKALMAVTGYAVLMHGLNAVVFYAVFKILGVPVGLGEVLVVTFPVVLLSLLPISFAGWGVREGAMVAGFGIFGVAPDVAVTVSVTFGLALLVASLPGGLLLLGAIWSKQRPEKR